MGDAVCGVCWVLGGGVVMWWCVDVVVMVCGVWCGVRHVAWWGGGTVHCV